MSKYLKFGLVFSLLSGPVYAETFGLGRAALPGEEIFADQCASCHGDFAEGIDNWPKLAGGADTLDHEDPLKTVGSYWPYLSTAFDYVKRSMPFGNAGSLSDDEVYAIVAYILYSNDLIEDDFVLSHENLAQFELPNTGGFIVDDRALTEYAAWSGEPWLQWKRSLWLRSR